MRAVAKTAYSCLGNIIRAAARYAAPGRACKRDNLDYTQLHFRWTVKLSMKGGVRPQVTRKEFIAGEVCLWEQWDPAHSRMRPRRRSKKSVRR